MTLQPQLPLPSMTGVTYLIQELGEAFLEPACPEDKHSTLLSALEDCPRLPHHGGMPAVDQLSQWWQISADFTAE